MLYVIGCLVLKKILVASRTVGNQSMDPNIIQNVNHLFVYRTPTGNIYERNIFRSIALQLENVIIWA